MVRRELDPEQARSLIKQTCASSLEPAIAVPRSPYAQNNLCTLFEFSQHGIDCAEIVLQVCIKAKGRIAPLCNGLKAGKNCCLLACVNCQPQAVEAVMVTALRFDQEPSLIRRAIVDKEDEAIFPDQFA